MWIEAADGRLVNSDFISSIKKSANRLVASMPDELSPVSLTKKKTEDAELDAILSRLLKDLNG